MLAVSGNELSLLVLGQRADGGGNADVAFQRAQFELVVAAGGILAGDLNALDRDQLGLALGQFGIL